MLQIALHENVRISIIDAVERLLKQYGYKKMTVDDIAKAAGIGKGTVYLYFPSKEEIALSWYDQVDQQLQKILWAIAGAGADPEAKIREIFLTRIMFAFDRSQDFRHSLDEIFSAIRLGFMERRDRYHADHMEIVSAVLQDGMNLGVFDFDDAQTTAQAMLLATNSLFPYSLSTAQLGEREEIEAKTKRVIGLILNGLLSRPAINN